MGAPQSLLTTVNVQQHSAWDVNVVSDVKGFAALEDAWNRLADQSVNAHPFCSFDWMWSWWNAFNTGRQLHILVARQRGVIQAIAPLMLVHGRVFGMPVRRLQSMSNEQTPRFDFLIGEHAGDAIQALWSSLRRHPSWDLLQLAEVPDAGPTLIELERLALDDDLPVGRWRSDASPYLTFHSGEADRYRRTVGRKHRSNVERLLRRLREAGPVELETIGQPDRLSAAMDDAVRLEASGWKDKVGTAIVVQPAVEKFYRALAHRQAAAGRLRLLFLKCADARIAFVYGLRQGNTFYMLKCGYDPEYARHAPVHLLCHLLFTQMRSRGLSTIDFLGANDEWKQRWTRRTTQHVWLYVFRDAWWTRLLCRTKFHLVPRLKQKPLYRSLLTRVRRRPLAGHAQMLDATEGLT
jgi:CelD/BcsL family acetyltransferase involved in cellulose biosynthesis